ncbi:MAG: peptidoglycan-associated lipoprotein Pal [Pseudomonadota bacterium]
MKLQFVAVLALTALLAACSSNDEELASTTGAGIDSAATGSGVDGSGLPPVNSPEYFNTVIGDRVFFETDSSQITLAGQDVLAQQANWLGANPGVTATIEGHADERGTRDYNLALGARRANAVRSFLASQGIDASRLKTVSFGKERPVSTCSNDSCWSENRRGVTVLAGGGVS